MRLCAAVLSKIYTLLKVYTLLGSLIIFFSFLSNYECNMLLATDNPETSHDRGNNLPVLVVHNYMKERINVSISPWSACTVMNLSTFEVWITSILLFRIYWIHWTMSVSFGENSRHKCMLKKYCTHLFVITDLVWEHTWKPYDQWPKLLSIQFLFSYLNEILR